VSPYKNGALPTGSAPFLFFFLRQTPQVCADLFPAGIRFLFHTKKKEKTNRLPSAGAFAGSRRSFSTWHPLSFSHKKERKN